MAVFELVQVTLVSLAFKGATVAVICAVSPLPTVAIDLSRLTPVTAILLTTVIAQVAVKPPSVVVAVMFVLPIATPVTMPEESTVAAFLLLELQLRLWSLAFAGRTAAVSCFVLPKAMVAAVASRLRPVTETFCTVMAHFALYPLAVVTVIVQLPSFKPLTRPDASTVATLASLVDQVKAVSVAVFGLAVAVSCKVLLRGQTAFVWSRLTPAAATDS